MRFALPEFQKIPRFGPGHRLVSRSALPESKKEKTMNATSPPIFSDWSGPAAPGCCLESRSPARRSSEKLQAALDGIISGRLHGRGSMIYATAWKPHVTPLGRRIFRLRASAPRTFDSEPSSERSGWPTASARDWKDSPGMATEGVNPDGSTRTRLDQLPRVAGLAGWPTISATEGERAGTGITDGMSGRSLTQMAAMSGPIRLTANGGLLTGSFAGMESGGQLNPEHSRWLMGFPVAWGFCGATAMQSFRRRRQSS